MGHAFKGTQAVLMGHNPVVVGLKNDCDVKPGLQGIPGSFIALYTREVHVMKTNTQNRCMFTVTQTLFNISPIFEMKEKVIVKVNFCAAVVRLANDNWEIMQYV